MIDRRFYTLRAPRTLGDIAARLHVALPTAGAAEEVIRSPSNLAESLPGNIVFFSDKRRRDQLITAKASACLTTENLAHFVTERGMIALVVDNPRAKFARLSIDMVTEGGSETYETDIDASAIIHPTAVIGKGVKIGAGTIIGAHTVIDPYAVIGADCRIDPLVRIGFAILGDRCSIKSSSVIGGAGFGMAEDEAGIFNIPHFGRVVLHNDVHIGSNSCVDRGQLGDTILMNNVKIDNLVQIAHNVFIDEGAMLAGHAGVSGSCRIGKNARFGGRAATADHVNIGDGAIIGAMAGVMSDVPDGEMWGGTPAMPIREHWRSIAVLKKLGKRK